MDTLRSMILGIVTPDDLMTTLHITQRTFYRWQKDPALIPVAVRLWLELKRGQLDQIHKDWENWRINTKTGELITPLQIAVTSTQIEHMNMAFNERDLLRRDNRLIRKEIGKLKKQSKQGAEIIPFPLGGRDACGRGPHRA